MTLATFAAMDALRAAFTGVPDLPALGPNHFSLEGFADSGTPGVKWKFCLLEGSPKVIVSEFGEPPMHETNVEGEFCFAVEGIAGAPRDTVFRDGVAAMADVLFPGGRGLAIPGKFEDFILRDVVRKLFQDEPGRLPIDVYYLDFALFVTAPTPLG